MVLMRQLVLAFITKPDEAFGGGGGATALGIGAQLMAASNTIVVSTTPWSCGGQQPRELL